MSMLWDVVFLPCKMCISCECSNQNSTVWGPDLAYFLIQLPQLLKNVKSYNGQNVIRHKRYFRETQVNFISLSLIHKTNSTQQTANLIYIYIYCQNNFTLVWEPKPAKLYMQRSRSAITAIIYHDLAHSDISPYSPQSHLISIQQWHCLSYLVSPTSGRVSLHSDIVCPPDQLQCSQPCLAKPGYHWHQQYSMLVVYISSSLFAPTFSHTKF